MLFGKHHENVPLADESLELAEVVVEMPVEDDFFDVTKSNDIPKFQQQKSCEIVNYKTVTFGDEIEIVEDDTCKRNGISVITMMIIVCFIFNNYILYF